MCACVCMYGGFVCCFDHRAGHLDEGDLRCSSTDNERQQPCVTVAVSTGKAEGRTLQGSWKRSEVTWRREDRRSYGRKIENHTDKIHVFVLVHVFSCQKNTLLCLTLHAGCNTATCSKYADKVCLCSNMMLLLKTDSSHGTAYIAI